MASYIRRREFLATLLSGAAAGWPLVARAQQPGKIPRIGIIDDSLHWIAFRHGLRDLGYLEGQNIVLRKDTPSDFLRSRPSWWVFRST